MMCLDNRSIETAEANVSRDVQPGNEKLRAPADLAGRGPDGRRPQTRL
jgi:hypothetical protein